MIKNSCKLIAILLLTVLCACSSAKEQPVDTDAAPALSGPVFNADTAWAYCAAQCAFGERTMNSIAHDQCGQWIEQQFRRLGCQTELQRADLKGWDGTMLHSTNIIARINPTAQPRLLICAHWDSRPWADNDPDSANWRKPVMAANDGASGVGVMLELARIINACDSLTLPYGIDLVCFDAEDYGAPDWSGLTDTEDTWALGAQYFAAQLQATGTKYSGGILLDMVGGQAAHFYHEGFSARYAQNMLTRVWQAAADAGYSSYFLNQKGGWITDDHKPLIDAGVPCIDVIPYYPDCEQSSFGPTWHTLSDTMDNLDRNTLKAVGQTLVQFLYSQQ